MATVHLARDLKHKRRVAIKVIRPELTAVLGLERFMREIEITARLNHPHILPLLDSGEAEGFLYYAMPYVDGESLRERLSREKQLPVEEAVQIAREVADALDYAHRQGVVHRDVKPENVLLQEGHAVVADFGIARAISLAGGERLTATGVAVGTPEYMSPEQASGRGDVDRRSDVYSLGCLLYEMLAGQPPFVGATIESVVHQHLTLSPRSVTAIRPSVRASVAAAVDQALAKSPADRYSSAAQFAIALLALHPERGLGAGAPLVSRRALAAGVLLTLGVVAIIWATVRSRPTPPIPIHRQVTFTGDAMKPAISPDGQFVAYTSARSLWVQDLTGGSPLKIADSVDRWDADPRWAPDGSRLVFYRDGNVYVVPRLGGTAHEVVHGEPDHCCKFAPSPDGTGLLVVVSDPARKELLVLVDTTKGVADTVGTVPPGIDIAALSWSLRGAPILLMGRRTDGSIVLGTIAPGSWTVDAVPAFALGALTNPRWNARGDGVYFVGRDADLVEVRVGSGGVASWSQPAALISGIPISQFDVSSDGRRLAYVREQYTSQIELFSLNAARGTSRVAPRVLTQGTHENGPPAISPDGRLVAFARGPKTKTDIWVVPTDGGEPRRVTFLETFVFQLQWSPDGTQVAFGADREGGARVLVVNVLDGTIASRGAHTVPPMEFSPGPLVGWSGDSKQLLYWVRGIGHWQLVALNVATGAERTVPGDSVATPVVTSPDGAHLLRPASPAREALQVLSLRDGTVLRTIRMQGAIPKGVGVEPLLWTASDLVYVTPIPMSRGRPRNEIWVVPASGGQARFVAALPPECGRLSLSANAQRVVCDITGPVTDIWIADHFDPAAR